MTFLQTVGFAYLCSSLESTTVFSTSGLDVVSFFRQPSQVFGSQHILNKHILSSLHRF